MTRPPLEIQAHGHRYRIHDPGGLVGNSLRAGNPYEAKVCQHIYRRRLNGVAIDAGAHIGNHSLWLAVVCGLKVHAFEALPDVRERLRANIALNEDADITVHDCALGAMAGAARHVGQGRLEPGGDLPVTPLDSLDLHDIALLKIDVEGMEPAVLEGAQDTIREQRPVLYVEAWNRAAHKRIAEILTPLGYEHVRTYGATPLEEWEPQ